MRKAKGGAAGVALGRSPRWSSSGPLAAPLLRIAELGRARKVRARLLPSGYTLAVL
jgi:hypothetical protein